MRNKKLEMPIIVLIVVIIAVVVTTVMMSQNRTNVDPNLNNVDSSEEADGSGEIENSKTEENKMYATINGEKLEIQLEDNATAVAFAKMLPLELTMSDLNGNEKNVNLDEALPTNSYEPGRVEAGDVMLYGDDCLVIFYKSFDTEYSYTKIGYIDGLPELGDGDVVVEFGAE
jgi:hypothetical protein